MSSLFWLTDGQMIRPEPVFPKSHGTPRVNDRRVLNGMILIDRNGVRWCDAPKAYGPPETLYDRGKRWGDKGVFARMREGLAAEVVVPKMVMIDATCLKAHRKAHRKATSLRSKDGGRRRSGGRLIGRTKGGMKTKLHAVTDADGRLIRFYTTAGQGSDRTGAAAAALLVSGSSAEWLLADRDHDADWFRDTVKDKG